MVHTLARRVKFAALLIVLFLVYLTAGKFGLMLASVNPSASAVWPPTGIAIASFLLFGNRIWLAVFLGAFFVNVTTAGTIATSLGIAVGNMLEGLVGAWLIRRFAGGRLVFDRAPNVFRFVLCCLVACGVSATVGVTTLTVGGFAQLSNFWPIWFTWWLGDVGGALIVAPFLITWGADTPPRFCASQWVELLLVFAATGIVGAIVFGDLFMLGGSYPLEFLALPILTWAAFRFSPREAATATLMLSSLAILGTLRGSGPFSIGVTPNESLLLLQAFTAATSVSTLVLSAAAREGKRAKDDAETEKAEIETMLQSLADGLFATDENGIIVHINPVAQQLTGYTRAHALGKHYTAVFHFVLETDKLTRPESIVQKALETGITSRETNHTLLVHQGGSATPVSSRAAPILRADGTARGCVVVVRNVSREREVEKAKDQFFSFAAHQLRTPLGSIRWGIEAILRGDAGDVPDHIRKHIGHIYASAHRLITLVNDLLNISRIEQGRLTDHPQRFSVHERLIGVVEEMQREAKTRNIVIHAEESDKSTQVMLDPAWFTEVLHNLISNAVKYSQDGGLVQVRVGVADHTMHISVEDSGIGINEKDAEKIFTKFFRAQNAIRAETEGTGLGLYLAKLYLDHWDGKIWFESELGSGSTFYVDIPLSQRSGDQKGNV